MQEKRFNGEIISCPRRGSTGVGKEEVMSMMEAAMKKVLFLLVLFVQILFVFTISVQAEQRAEEILKGVVKVRAVIPKDAHTASTLGTEREGSGVVIDSEGLILTTGYLIVEAESLEVVTSEGKRVEATFVGYDYNSGFGLLRADKALGVKPLELGQSSAVKTGDLVLVAAHGGAEAVVTASVVGRREFVGYWEYILDDAIYTAPAYAQFGGAALLNAEGRLLGIGSLLSQITIPGLGAIPANVFIPVDLLPPVLADLKTMGRPRAMARPWLGINVEETHGRLIVSRVTPKGPADRAGLKVGDILLKVRGEAVGSLGEFYRKVWALGRAGVEVPISVLQGVEIREMTIRSGDRYEFLTLRPKKI